MNNLSENIRERERERELKTTPTTTITLDDVRKELKITGSISLNDTKVRELAKKPSGIISMADLRGRTLITTIHKKVLVFYSYKPNSQGEDIEEYPRFIFPVEHFVNGVVRIIEFTSNGSHNLFDQCSLNIKNPEQVINLDYEYGGLEGAKQKFKFEIPDSNNNPLKDSYVWISQTGGYYDDWGNPDIGPEWVEETTGYKLAMELEADFDSPTDFKFYSPEKMRFLFSGGKYKFVENGKEYIFRGFVFNDPEKLFTCIEPIKHFNIDNTQEESYPGTPNFKIIYTPDEIMKFNLQNTLLYFGFWEGNMPSSYFGNVTGVLAFNNNINTNDYYLYDAYWEDIYGGTGTQDDIEFLKHEENCYIGKMKNAYNFADSDINNEGLYQVELSIYNNI